VTISFLKNEEIDHVVSVIDQILLTKKFESILKNKALIMVHKKRKNIFLIDETDERFINSFSVENREDNCKTVYFKINLGFWIRDKFRIGIESLPFLAQFCDNPIILPSKRQVTKFIYGKNIEILLNDSIRATTRYTDGSVVIVSTNKRIPLGYARLKLKKDKIHLKNVIDIGIYLRSEKTAF